MDDMWGTPVRAAPAIQLLPENYYNCSNRKHSPCIIIAVLIRPYVYLRTRAERKILREN